MSTPDCHERRNQTEPPLCNKRRGQGSGRQPLLFAALRLCLCPTSKQGLPPLCSPSKSPRTRAWPSSEPIDSMVHVENGGQQSPSPSGSRARRSHSRHPLACAPWRRGLVMSYSFLRLWLPAHDTSDVRNAPRREAWRESILFNASGVCKAPYEVPSGLKEEDRDGLCL